MEAWKKDFEANNETFRIERIICQFEKLNILAH